MEAIIAHLRCGHERPRPLSRVTLAAYFVSIYLDGSGRDQTVCGDQPQSAKQGWVANLVARLQAPLVLEATQPGSWMRPPRDAASNDTCAWALPLNTQSHSYRWQGRPAIGYSTAILAFPMHLRLWRNIPLPVVLKPGWLRHSLPYFCSLAVLDLERVSFPFWLLHTFILRVPIIFEYSYAELSKT